MPSLTALKIAYSKGSTLYIEGNPTDLEHVAKTIDDWLEKTPEGFVKIVETYADEEDSDIIYQHLSKNLSDFKLSKVGIVSHHFVFNAAVELDAFNRVNVDGLETLTTNEQTGKDND